MARAGLLSFLTNALSALLKIKAGVKIIIVLRYMTVSFNTASLAPNSLAREGLYNNPVIMKSIPMISPKSTV